MKFTALSVQRRQLTEQVIEHLQEEISLEKMVVGTKLPSEPELTAQLGVSRTTLREAVRVLAHAGLLEVRQGDGTYIRAKTVAESLERRLQRAAVLEVYEVRRMIELEMARLAAQRRDETDLARMSACLQQRQSALQAGDDAGFLNADIDFHNAIASASKNAVLADLYQTFSKAVREALSKLVADAEAYHDDQSLPHEQLLDAITAGDAEAASRWTAEYLDSTMQHLRLLAR